MGWKAVTRWATKAVGFAVNMGREAVSSFVVASSVSMNDPRGQAEAIERNRALREAAGKLRSQQSKAEQDEIRAKAVAAEEKRRQNQPKKYVPKGELSKEVVKEDRLSPQPSHSERPAKVPLTHKQEKEIKKTGGLLPAWLDGRKKWLQQGTWHIVDEKKSNVYAFRYDITSKSLYVQYKHWEPSMPYGSQNGPGPVYEYKHVSAIEASDAYKAERIDDWLWANIRVPGTWSLHRKPYKLDSIQGYLPRKAEWNYKGDGDEWFVKRKIGGTESELPTKKAPPMGMGGEPVFLKHAVKNQKKKQAEAKKKRKQEAKKKRRKK